MATLTKSVPTQDGRANFTYTCTVTENSYNTSNNTSNVTITFAIKGPWAPTFYEWATSYGIIVDGSVKKTGSSSPYVSTSAVQLLTWTGDISHSNDGTKAIKVNVYLTNGSASYLPVQYTSSSSLNMGSVTLTTIPRASTITSASNINLGNNCGITFTPASSSFYYNIRFSLGSWHADTGLFCPGKTTSYTYSSYAIPADNTTYALIPNSTTGTMTATLTTYSSNSTSAQIGSASSKTFVVTVPNNTTTTPKCGTITLTPQTYSYLIHNKNKLTIDVDASGCQAGAGSSIKSYTFSGPGIATTTTNTSVTSGGTISNTGTLTYTVTVTDSRGRTASKTAKITCHAWSAPSITLDAYRVSSSSSTTKNDNGTFVRCAYNLTYSSVNNTNDITVKIYYKKSSASSYSSVTALDNKTDRSGSYTLSNIDVNSTYTVYATVTDNYSGQASSSQIAIFGASRILNITSDGTGVAFGKMAENTNMLESRYRIKAPGLTSTRGTRPTSMNIEADSDHVGCLEYFLLDGDATEGNGDLLDGPVLHCHWDNTTGYESQLHIRNTTGEISSRGMRQGVWSDWRTSLDSVNYTNYVTPKPTVLYDNDSNESYSISLTDSTKNYSCIEIFYKDNYTGADRGYMRKSTRVYNPFGKIVELSFIEPNSSGNGIYIRSSLCSIATSTMTAYTGSYTSLQTNNAVNVTNNRYIYITQVLGYK